MTRTKSTYLALLTVLLAPMAAQADLTDFGPSGEYFFDTDTGLYWQDIANFLGQTQAEVEAFVAASVIWDLASQAEMEALLGASSQGGVSLTEIMGPRQLAITGGDRWVGFLDVTTVDPLLPGDPNGWLVQTNAAGLSTITATGFQNSVELQTHGAWVNSSVNPAIEPANNNFSIVIVPDSQSYAEENPEILEAQVQWIVDNAGESDENIVYVAQLGDLKDNDNCADVQNVTNGSGNNRSEWLIVSEAFGRLDTAGIPYGVVPGNHDFDQRSGGCPNYSTQRPLTVYNHVDNFNPMRYEFEDWYGDGTTERGNRVDGSNEDNFTLFSGACGVEFISINLAYKEVASGRTNGSVCADLNDLTGDGCEIEWADSLLKAHPDRLGIITSHNFLKENAQGNLNTFGGDYGQDVYDGLADNANLAMMLSAHKRGEAWRQATAGRGSAPPVQAILSNYQSSEYPEGPDGVFYADDGGGCAVATEDGPGPGGDDYFFDSACTDAVDFSRLVEDRLQGSDGGDGGFMRIMRFDTATQTVSVEAFAPAVDFTGLTYDDGSPAPANRDIVLRSNIVVNPVALNGRTASNFSFSFMGYGSPVIAPSCTP